MYSDIILEHFQNPCNIGELEQPDCEGIAGKPGYGNYMVLQINIADEIITAARYRCHGCGPAIAAGSILTTLIIGQTVEQSLSLTEQDLNNAMGGLPPGKEHCAKFAIEALQNAIVNLNG